MTSILNSEIFRLVVSIIFMVSTMIYIDVNMFEVKKGRTIAKCRIKQVVAYIAAFAVTIEITSASDRTIAYIRAFLAIVWTLLSYSELVKVKKLKEVKEFETGINRKVIEITEEMKQQFFNEYGEDLDQGEIDEEKLKKINEFFQRHKEYLEDKDEED